ncbi:hypothetical protein, partial [Rhizobium leguminosarum]|uniref:hypothetical protein n=1 Tax=Rhizobium leguminosarum TaxID=384 RepID=UPI003F9B06C1
SASIQYPEYRPVNNFQSSYEIPAERSNINQLLLFLNQAQFHIFPEFFLFPSTKTRLFKTQLADFNCFITTQFLPVTF